MKCFAVLLQTRSRVREKKLFDPSKATGGFSGRRIKVYTRAVVRERKRRCGQRRAEDREKTENSGNDPAHVTGVKKIRRAKGWGRGGEKKRNAVTLAIAVGRSDDCVFMLYPEERSNTFQEEGT